MKDVTVLLSAIHHGDQMAADQLLPLVYEELRKLAATRLSRERTDQTLQATALVHEAWLRLVDVDLPQEWNSRGHFFAAAAEAMRRILVESARRRQQLKRGGGVEAESFQDVELATEPGVTQLDLLALDDALTRLSATEPEASQLVQLRYFTGLSIPEAAEAMGVSPRSADRLWAFAKAWLHRELSGAG
ncbi:MAG: sigma-70 family RNA polymerase sigma factor [Planctomyces sp.]|nr:sigma-70 family RNA polymerase sigma factor [Planctomyces sp.]